MYAGEVDVLTGQVIQTWGHITSYNGETLTGEWWSTYENSSSAAQPTTGVEVIYELASPQTSSITGLALTTETGHNVFEINQGTIKTFTYEADGSIVSNLNITSGVITLGDVSLNSQQLARLLALIN